MKRDNRTVSLWSALASAALGLSMFAGGVATAQTAHYPATGPKPSKWAGAPDWSGIWERDGDNVWDNRIPPTLPQTPPYNAAYQKKADEPSDAPRGAAFHTMPGMMNMLFPMDLQISPSQVTILSENGSPRRIYTDGRVHADDTLPSSAGHSVGRWVKGELLVDTCCVRNDTRLPGGGPHSESMVIKERFYLRDHKTLVDEITVEDPEAFTKPWTTEKIWYRRPDWESVEYDREENDRDAPGAAGAPADGGRPRPVPEY
ncbi:MAG: hypothetical protein JWP92_1636 [Caulobacter sp.]|nr:hypothetical protein [Caulobacter sp.]